MLLPLGIAAYIAWQFVIAIMFRLRAQKVPATVVSVEERLSGGRHGKPSAHVYRAVYRIDGPDGATLDVSPDFYSSSQRHAEGDRTHILIADDSPPVVRPGGGWLVPTIIALVLLMSALLALVIGLAMFFSLL